MGRERGHPPDIVRAMSLTAGLWDELRSRPGPFLFTLLGVSMWPAAPPGSVLSVWPCASSALAPGKLLLFRNRQSIVTHKVVRVQPDGQVLAWGDSLLAPDGLIEPADVLGRATLTTRAPVSVGWRSGWLLMRRMVAEVVRLQHGARGTVG